MPARVYVMLIDGDGRVLARRYLDAEQVSTWLTVVASHETVRCDVYDDAPPCGGRLLSTLYPQGRTWRERAA